MALLLAQARNIPQAHSALKNGKWERSKWEGVELHGKTLGVVGLGKIGALVAQRALAFGMHLVAYDPFISEERARHMGVELVDLETLLARSDFITIHLPKTKETTNLLDAEALAKTKPGVRIINVARGGIVNEADLAEAIRNGHVQGAALDVFEKEPTTESPLFDLALGRRRAPPGRVDRRSAGQGRRRRSPSRSPWRWRATSCPSPSTWRPAKSPTWCDRSWVWPNSSGDSSADCSTASPPTSRSSTRASSPARVRRS